MIRGPGPKEIRVFSNTGQLVLNETPWVQFKAKESYRRHLEEISRPQFRDESAFDGLKITASNASNSHPIRPATPIDDDIESPSASPKLQVHAKTRIREIVSTWAEEVLKNPITTRIRADIRRNDTKKEEIRDKNLMDIKMLKTMEKKVESSADVKNKNVMKSLDQATLKVLKSKLSEIQDETFDKTSGNRFVGLSMTPGQHIMQPQRHRIEESRVTAIGDSVTLTDSITLPGALIPQQISVNVKSYVSQQREAEPELTKKYVVKKKKNADAFKLVGSNTSDESQTKEPMYDPATFRAPVKGTAKDIKYDIIRQSQLGRSLPMVYSRGSLLSDDQSSKSRGSTTNSIMQLAKKSLNETSGSIGIPPTSDDNPGEFRSTKIPELAQMAESGKPSSPGGRLMSHSKSTPIMKSRGSLQSGAKIQCVQCCGVGVMFCQECSLAYCLVCWPRVPHHSLKDIASFLALPESRGFSPQRVGSGARPSRSNGAGRSHRQWNDGDDGLVSPINSDGSLNSIQEDVFGNGEDPERSGGGGQQQALSPLMPRSRSVNSSPSRFTDTSYDRAPNPHSETRYQYHDTNHNVFIDGRGSLQQVSTNSMKQHHATVAPLRTASRGSEFRNSLGSSVDAQEWAEFSLSVTHYDSRDPGEDLTPAQRSHKRAEEAKRRAAELKLAAMEAERVKQATKAKADRLKGIVSKKDRRKKISRTAALSQHPVVLSAMPSGVASADSSHKPRVDSTPLKGISHVLHLDTGDELISGGGGGPTGEPLSDAQKMALAREVKIHNGVAVYVKRAPP